ncbi:NAD-dependent epimerase/dehydratase family protein [Comamonas terrigena]|uniref:NAD-dependent epimerase/dehydratase family protein n=1 Tax=Comamonas terrigena TaxID=32013 RepID=UPI00244CAB8E|nr:NAD-dependent epimerase/dehydratase family protein [Comamonas terrigena]MDH1289689.1 NAD-dependent epimerase/dehydratase family protein [Comamonas terrigena]
MRILITGGSGFIGSHLALRLVREGHEITVVDNLSPQIHGVDPEVSSQLYISIRDKVHFVHGDVCDPEVWSRCLTDQEAVVNLAAETGTGQSMYEIHRYAEVNVGGTARMLDWLANNQHSVKRMVVASSRAIYGEGKYVDEEGYVVYPDARREEDMKSGRFEPLSAKTGKPLRVQATDEESKIHPSSVYGITKQNQEQMTMTVCPLLGIEPVALRYQNVYGPGQSLKNPYTGILSIFSTRILNGNPIQVFEDGHESRDFVFIDDVIDATCLALFRPQAANEVFGIGSGVATNVIAVANALVEYYAARVPVTVTGAFRLGDIRHNFADLAKARRLLGFEPKIEFFQGLELFSKWVKEQAIEEDAYEKSIREMQKKGLFKS